MRALLAAVMTLTLVAATTVDRLDCQDGCTDPAQRGSATTTVSACGLCHGWSGSGATSIAAPPSRLVPPLIAAAGHELAPHRLPVDRPPRVS